MAVAINGNGTVTGAEVGDYNSDGVVGDASDYLDWRFSSYRNAYTTNVGYDIFGDETDDYNQNTHEELSLITNASQFADQNNLEVHSGHGITFDSIVELSRIKEIKEFNIGHFIISESVYKGLENVIKRFKELIRQNRV